MPFTSVTGASSVIKPGVVTSSTRPSAPYVGQLIFETDTNRLAVYNGSSWIMLADADTPPGLELVKTQTIGTAVSSVEVTGAFSSTYDNYRIVLSGGVSSATVTLRWTMGSTATGYYYGARYTDYAGTSGLLASANGANWAFGAGSASGLTAVFDLLCPFLAEETSVLWNYTDILTNGSSVAGSGYLNNTTSYTSITVAPSSGTLTGGTIRVYGYRNS